MSDLAIPVTPAEPNKASLTTPVAAPEGTLSITTEPAPLAVVVCDDKMNTVAEGVSPLQVQLAPGLYIVRATLAGHSDLKSMARVISNSDRSIHLAVTEPNLIRAATSLLSLLVDKYVRGLDALPPQGIKQATDEREVTPEPFSIRFLQLKDWNCAERVQLPKFSSAYVRGRAILDVVNSQQNVVFAQIAGPSKSVLNVALPPAGALRPARCQLVVSASTDLLTAHVRLSTEWANAAMQYMSQGYIQEAKQLVAAGNERAPSGVARLALRITNRFDDPAAAFVPRYLGLRTREATLVNTIGDSLLDLLQLHLSDGVVISAELAARERNFKLAAQHIMTIRTGRIPLFTEGFSLLIHRVRDLLDIDPELVVEDHRPSSEQIAKLKELWKTLGRWAPHLDLNCPTVTFFGNDVTAPKMTETQLVPTAADGWIRSPNPPKS